MKFTPRLIAPLLLLAPSAAKALDVTALSGAIVDAASGKLLWEKDSLSPRFPASTTKVMTALLLIEHSRPNDIVVAPPEIETVKDSSMHLKPGEHIRVKDLLYGMMLRSANDGAYAAAIYVGGSVQGFARIMNERAQSIGCKGTHFNNPNGLPDPKHFTCAYDLAMIGREAMKYSEFREVVKTKRYEIDRSLNYRDRMMVNRNKWLQKDPTADGIKTGWTVAAGHCYVGSAVRNGYRVIDAIMKSANWQQDHADMLDYAFDTYEPRNSVKLGQAFATATIAGAQTNPIPIAPMRDAYALVHKGDTREVQERVVIDPQVRAPLKAGQEVGYLEMTDPEGFVQKVPLMALADVQAIPTIVGRAASSPGFLFFGGGLCVGALWVRGRARKAAKKYAVRQRTY